MAFLHTGKKLARSEIFSVFYHNLFDYPMTFSDIVRWNPKNAPGVNVSIDYKNGFYFIEGRGGLIYRNTLRKRISDKKIKIARKASKVISFVPTIEMICLSGSLAMNNATEESDIDLLIVTKKGKLWSSRIMVYLVLKLFGFSLRKPGIKKKEIFIHHMRYYRRLHFSIGESTLKNFCLLTNGRLIIGRTEMTLS